MPSRHPPGRPLGVVAFAFGLRAPQEEPNPSNVALASIVADLVGANPSAVVVAQWEIAKQLARDGVPVAWEVRPTPGRYLDSKEVWRQARIVLDRQGIRHVVPVAQPFLHLRYCHELVRAEGYHVHPQGPTPVPFDRSRDNRQWWTRSRTQLAVYALGKEVRGLQPLLRPLVGPWPD